MPARTHRLAFLAIILALIFLGAQFHYCADLSFGTSGSHICPVCSATGSAVVPLPPGISVAMADSSLVFFTEIAPPS
jgi:hypothetical protein